MLSLGSAGVWAFASHTGLSTSQTSEARGQGWRGILGTLPGARRAGCCGISTAPVASVAAAGPPRHRPMWDRPVRTATSECPPLASSQPPHPPRVKVRHLECGLGAALADFSAGSNQQQWQALRKGARWGVPVLVKGSFLTLKSRESH